MQEIKDLMANKEPKKDIYDINQQFIEDVKNIKRRSKCLSFRYFYSQI